MIIVLIAITHSMHLELVESDFISLILEHTMYMINYMFTLDQEKELIMNIIGVMRLVTIMNTILIFYTCIGKQIAVILTMDLEDMWKEWTE